MKLKLTYLLLISIPLLSAKGGCSDEENEQAIVGEWQWVKTFCCGRTSVWTNPDSCKCTMSLTVLNNGTFRVVKDDVQVQEGTYILRKGLNDFQQTQGDSALVIQMNEDYPAYIEFIGDTLLLARGYMDFDNVYYVRKSSK